MCAIWVTSHRLQISKQEMYRSFLGTLGCLYSGVQGIDLSSQPPTFQVGKAFSEGCTVKQTTYGECKKAIVGYSEAKSQWKNAFPAWEGYNGAFDNFELLPVRK